jgi:hypothetical protein
MPHLTQYEAFSGVETRQFGQILFPDMGGTPQATQITALSETSFPQFLQYILTVFIWVIQI